MPRGQGWLMSLRLKRLIELRAPGIIILNPPYGARIGNKGPLFGLYAAMGEVFRNRFGGWRVGIITSEGGLAKATGLSPVPGPIVAHGGLKVRLWQTAVL